jgi:glycosyltransferase involved in cell wall biosynthesis
MRNSSHVFLNSNRWYSAVSDYCFQLMAWMRIHSGQNVVIGCQSDGPLVQKAEQIHIQVAPFSFFPPSLRGWVSSWCALTKVLSGAQAAGEKTQVVWTFEGREHTLAAVHRKVRKDLWGETRLVRVRGQAAPAKQHFFNRWLYSKATHGVVFVADVVKERSGFEMPFERSLVFPYCADFSEGLRPWELGYGKPSTESDAEVYNWMEGAPPIEFARTLFLVVGRYDPVKGHKELLDAFAKMNTAEKPVQLVFVGCSENVKAYDVFSYALEKLGGSKFFQHKRGVVVSADGLKRFYICDERFADVSLFVKKAHWGVVPSLGSEVICRVAVEFLQNGTPCVATRVGALPEVLAGSPSKVVPMGEIEAWVRALEGALAIATDVSFFPHVRTQCKRFGLDKYAWTRYSALVKWAQNLPKLP